MRAARIAMSLTVVVLSAACEPSLTNPLDPRRGGGFNTAPMLAALDPIEVATGERLYLVLQASDRELDPLTLAASGLPAGAIFDPATGALDFTPAASQIGDYEIVLSANDGTDVTTVAFMLRVLPGGSESLRLFRASGDGQQAAFGAALPAPLVVRVMARQPVANQRIRFEVIEGEGVLGSGAAIDEDITDDQGLARTKLTLGSTCLARVRATLVATGATVELHARGGLGGTELLCNGRDDDCDPATLDDPDGDGDLFGVCSDCDDADAASVPTASTVCTAPTASDRDGDGFASTLWGGDDCDDDNPAINPDAEEVCDIIDQDCDGDPYRVDRDRDGFVDIDCPEGGGSDCVDNVSQLCARYGTGAGGSGLFSPCDELSFATRLINPGMAELCDGVDNNCDGGIDDVDADGDGEGVCDDCNDHNPDQNHSALEVCDGKVDNDCDGLADLDDVARPGDAGVVADADGDGQLARGCGGRDCDDNNPAVFFGPKSMEICDGIDNNCDDLIDDVDEDGDGHISVACGGDDCVDNWQQFCARYGGVAPYATCDATVAYDFKRIYTGAREYCDGIDSDCGGEASDSVDPDLVDGDGDGDGQAGLGCGGLDCDDTNPWVKNGGQEYCDGIDNDCDTAVDEVADGDLDGVPGVYCGGFDCNDRDPRVSPMAPEYCDGIDNNCNTLVDEVTDGDGDGYIGVLCDDEGDDCRDDLAYVHPGAVDVCDGTASEPIDSDCDPLTPDVPDGDGDGVVGIACSGCSGAACTAYDCDDADPAVKPGVAEICFDGRDQDCDNVLDCADTPCSTNNGGLGTNGSFETVPDFSRFHEGGAAAIVTRLGTGPGILPTAGTRMAALSTGTGALGGKLSGFNDCGYNFVPGGGRKFLIIDVNIATQVPPTNRLVCNDTIRLKLTATPPPPGDVWTRTHTLDIANQFFGDDDLITDLDADEWYETGWIKDIAYPTTGFVSNTQLQLDVTIEKVGTCAEPTTVLIDNIRFAKAVR